MPKLQQHEYWYPEGDDTRDGHIKMMVSDAALCGIEGQEIKKMSPRNMVEKPCSRCRVPKPLTEFHKGSGRFGRDSRCKTCCAAPKKLCPVCGDKKRMHKRSMICEDCKRDMIGDGEYYCTICEQILPVNNFVANHHGIRNRCNPCRTGIGTESIDRKYGVIAPRYQKPPYPNRKDKKVCKHCAALPHCEVYLKLHIPLCCEKVSKSDILSLGRVGVEQLREIGWTDRTLLWDDATWERYYEAVKEIT